MHARAARQKVCSGDADVRTEVDDYLVVAIGAIVFPTKDLVHREHVVRSEQSQVSQPDGVLTWAVNG